MNNITRYISMILGLLLAFLLSPGISYSQIPQNTPQPTGPIDFSETSNVIIYVVIPGVILIVFLIFRKRILRAMQERRDRIRKEK
ncbi:hypothetical protein LV84_02477 [Algoriphagus ratkowskyi]|uniref:Uncharacterized protein n=1 Tax=Algoriphagus ratkowskyi TaxID=57028 RepID=A0A2W7RL86_9BACT|nr:hypothetical protein [Algoriphagus ratkowskyi]PZX55339.1 hypothetical protein LV84_02477 [Algoriphagus ratkowskyi]TXD79730.1 hypothetical protein ESW18_00945 [Algoriphagus ratkowskyi]